MNRGLIHGPGEESGARELWEALNASYQAFGAVVATVTDETSWLPTDCLGWAVRDLVFHCVGDAQRALVAFHTPVDQDPDRDAMTYWSDWQPDTVGAANGRRFTRVVAGMFLDVGQLCALYQETAAAVLVAASRVDADSRVGTQGHVLTAGDLMATLAVEATVHHLDLPTAELAAPGPSSQGLACVRRTLDGLLGHPVPVPWDDARYARAATGRAPLTDAEREALGADVTRLPLFG